jgi:hypothetical protein
MTQLILKYGETIFNTTANYYWTINAYAGGDYPNSTGKNIQSVVLVVNKRDCNNIPVGPYFSQANQYTYSDFVGCNSPTKANLILIR